jgi:hypothetical protein
LVLVVDQRLFEVAGKRLVKLTRVDTPEVARALAAYYHHQAQVVTGVLNEVTYVRLFNPGVLDVVIRGDDWVKILPYVTNGFFDSTLYPEPTLFVAQSSVLSDATTIDQTSELYQRILNVLNELFTIEFPQAP